MPTYLINRYIPGTYNCILTLFAANSETPGTENNKFKNLIKATIYKVRVHVFTNLLRLNLKFGCTCICEVLKRLHLFFLYPTRDAVTTIS